MPVWSTGQETMCASDGVLKCCPWVNTVRKGIRVVVVVAVVVLSINILDRSILILTFAQ
jgi:hypothetical protein